MTAKPLSINDLPLREPTPDAWAKRVLEKPLELLNDHAHLERKAAANALDLFTRWPEPNPPEGWAAAMAAITREESEHLGVVCRLLTRRGGVMSRGHQNPYAAMLRKEVRLGSGDGELVDRLLVSALIEVRSCERFAVLNRCCQDREMAKLYGGLYASELGHFHTFLQLAEVNLPAEPVPARWEELLDAEAAIIRRQPRTPTMHSGW